MAEPWDLPTFPSKPSPATLPVKLRQARVEDIDPLLELEDGAFHTDRLSRRSFRRLVGASGAHCLVAEARRRPVGYALVLFRRNATVARLYSIAVDPRWRGHGIAGRLMAAAEAEARARGARAMRLEVREDNADAIALYARRGYRPIGRRSDYYADRAAALRFEKRLDGDPAQ